nr:hypothetical protein [Agrobacterium tomkonis]
MGSGGISFATATGLATAAGDGGVGSGSSSLAADGMRRLSDPPGRPAIGRRDEGGKNFMGMSFTIGWDERPCRRISIRRSMAFAVSGFGLENFGAVLASSDFPIQLFTAALAMAGQGPL